MNLSEKKITMLVDYRKYFYMSVRHKDASMNLESIQDYFSDKGWQLQIKKFTDIDLRTDNYRDRLILYQSSEDRDLFYKNYIEDVLLALELQGAVLIPKFHYFRAHHNKVFMEMLRDISPLTEIQNIQSKSYGTFEEFQNDSPDISVQKVLKPSEGCGSSGVKLLSGAESIKRHARKVSRSIHMLDALKNIVKSMVWHPYVKRSNHRKKFLLQNYVADLKNDYKILVYGEKYYVLFRQNRENDFRASGSGLFRYEEDLPEGLLDYANRVFNSFSVPYISLDVGFDGSHYYLIEFQFVSFGTYTLEKSPFYFRKTVDAWQTVKANTDLEKEFVTSVVSYLSPSDNTFQS